jgi:hypothetical protein
MPDTHTKQVSRTFLTATTKGEAKLFQWILSVRMVRKQGVLQGSGRTGMSVLPFAVRGISDVDDER